MNHIIKILEWIIKLKNVAMLKEKLHIKKILLYFFERQNNKIKV